MAQRAVGYEDSDIPLESGRLRLRRWGAADAPVVVCVPGLSANLCGFDRLAERLAGETLQLVAIKLFDNAEAVLIVLEAAPAFHQTGKNFFTIVAER